MTGARPSRQESLTVSVVVEPAPEVTGALYFVATGRGDGSHTFSATFEEHERAVADYLRRLRSRQ